MLIQSHSEENDYIYIFIFILVIKKKKKKKKKKLLRWKKISYTPYTNNFSAHPTHTKNDGIRELFFQLVQKQKEME